MVIRWQCRREPVMSISAQRKVRTAMKPHNDQAQRGDEAKPRIPTEL